MKTFCLLLLATTAFAAPALAEDYRVASALDAVTVYPQGADVTRVAKLTVKPGDHALILPGLPGAIDPQSIRVSGEAGEGVEISSVDSKTVPLLPVDTDEQRRNLEKQITALTDERSALDQTMRFLARWAWASEPGMAISVVMSVSTSSRCTVRFIIEDSSSRAFPARELESYTCTTNHPDSTVTGYVSR